MTRIFLLLDIRPREPLESGEIPDSRLEWFRLLIRIEAVGTYTQLVKFAIGLERMERLIVLTEIHFERTERLAPRLVCTMSGFALVQEGL